MKTKEEITENWLYRYTGTNINEFGKYVLLTNFYKYVQLFAEWFKVPINGEDRSMPTATSDNISIVNFGIFSFYNGFLPRRYH